MKNVKTFYQFVNEGKGNDVVVIVQTKSGELEITRDEMEEMLDDLDMYWAADNFPKWYMNSIYTSNYRNPKKKKEVTKKAMEDLIKHKGNMPMKMNLSGY